MRESLGVAGSGEDVLLLLEVGVARGFEVERRRERLGTVIEPSV